MAFSGLGQQKVSACMVIYLLGRKHRLDQWYDPGKGGCW